METAKNKSVVCSNCGGQIDINTLEESVECKQVLAGLVHELVSGLAERACHLQNLVLAVLDKRLNPWVVTHFLKDALTLADTGTPVRSVVHVARHTAESRKV